MYISEKYHSPLFGYAKQIEKLYHKVCDELNYKIKNKDFKNSKVDDIFDNYLMDAQEVSIQINLKDIGIDIINLSNSINFIIYNINDAKFKDYFEENKGSRFLVYGSFDYSIEQYIDNEKMYIDKNDFNCYIYAYNCEIDPKSFYLVFYHEFNHLYKRYNVLKQNTNTKFNNIIESNITTDLINIIKNTNNLSNDDKNVLIRISYMLLNKDELYAFANSIKGELIAIYRYSTSNDSIENIFKSTQTYKEYLKLKYCYEYLVNMDPEQLFKFCIILYKVYNRYDYKNQFEKYYLNSDDVAFKNKLLFIVKRNLDLFRKQILNICYSTEIMENYKFRDKQRGKVDGKMMKLLK